MTTNATTNAPRRWDLSRHNRENLTRRTIDQTADTYHDLKALKSPETAKRYRREIQFFFDYMRRWGADPADATQPHLVDYLDYLAHPHPEHPGPCWTECHNLPYAPASQAHRVDVLRNFYEYAVANGQAPGNPARGLPVIVPKADFVDHLTQDEATCLWEDAKGHSWRDGTIIGLGLACGLRREEIKGARVENLGRNQYGMTLRFWRVKAKQWQTINIDGPLADLITKQVAGRSHGYIVHSRRKAINEVTGVLEMAPISLRGINFIVSDIGNYTGVRPDDIYPHLLRKTSITYSRTRTGLLVEKTMAYYGHTHIKDHNKYDAFAQDSYAREIILAVQGPHFWNFALAA